MKDPTHLRGKTSSTGKQSAHNSIPLWLKFLKSLFWEGVARMKDSLAYYYQIVLRFLPDYQSHRENIKSK